MNQAEDALRYRIEVRGLLDPEWSAWFDGMTVRSGRDSGGPLTVISGPVPDQSALQGILTKVWNLNLPLLTVTCLAGYGVPASDRGVARGVAL